MKQKSKHLKPTFDKAIAWLSVSFERSAIVGVLFVGLILGSLILTMEKGGGSEHGEEEGGHGGEKHGEEGGHEEGKEVELPDDAVEGSNIKIEKAGEATIQKKLKLSGRLVPNRDRYTVITPRFPGVIKSVRKNLGDTVGSGEVLAVIESNSARAPFEVRTGIGGVVIDRQAIAGNFAPEGEAIFKIADLSSVWVEINVPDRDFGAVKVGQPISVRDAFSKVATTVTVSYISPVVNEDTQSLLLRAEIPNRDGQWKAGGFVDAEITIEDVKVPVAVRSDAVQKIEDEELVFVRDGEHFFARPVVLGRKSRDFVEIKSGVNAGENYAAGNSFIVKAELLKSTAAHEH